MKKKSAIKPSTQHHVPSNQSPQSKTQNPESSASPKRLRVLISAYACEPNKGSEPGVGWNISKEMAKHHDVWVLTRSNNRKVIEDELASNPVEGLHFFYHDLPTWAKWWKKGGRGVQLYYYLWQLTAISTVRKKHREVGFDLSHHVTFVKYWAPSCLAWLDVPFVWGPVGGGDSTPLSFLRGGGIKSCIHELGRDAMRFLAKFDFFVRATANRCVACIPVTCKTERCVKKLNSRIKTKVITQVGLSRQELLDIDSLTVDDSNMDNPVFLYVGNLLFLKGVHLAIRAFAEAYLHDAELWIVGEGPEKEALSSLAKRLKVNGRVKFLGQLDREDVLATMKRSTVLVHPSLHDSGGFVPVEAMACGKPVVCLDLAGPGILVPDVAGFRIKAIGQEQSIKEMAKSMQILASDPELCAKMGVAGKEHVRCNYLWEKKAERIDSIYKLSVL